MGAAIGREILEGRYPHKARSVLASAAKLGLPVTVHAAIGTDIHHMHASADGAALGATSYRDFETLASLVATLEGGVLFNVGSAVILPEVFLKALALARNLGYRVRRFTTVNLDFMRQYRPSVNVVERPTRLGGRGISLIGHHEIMLPLLAAALVEAAEGTAMKRRITIVEGDLTAQQVDAIVNAANSALVLGAGVAGAIRARGGPAIQDECDAIGPIAVGDAALTGAGELPARFVIHAASMPPGGSASEASVRASLRRALELARGEGLRTIAVPAVGAGIAGFPLQRCAEILVEEARRHLAGETSLEEIRFVLFGEPAYRVFEMVHDAAKVAEQMERLRERRP